MLLIVFLTFGNTIRNMNLSLYGINVMIDLKLKNLDAIRKLFVIWNMRKKILKKLKYEYVYIVLLYINV